MARLVLDTSVALTYLLESHQQHTAVRRYLAGHDLCLTTHSLAETYSVLTRLSGDARLPVTEAASVIERAFPQVVALRPEVAQRLHIVLSGTRLAGARCTTRSLRWRRCTAAFHL